MEKKIKSPYTAAMTGCSFMWEEMTHILPLLMSPDSGKLLKQEVIENNYMSIHAKGQLLNLYGDTIPFRVTFGNATRHFQERQRL